MPSKLTILQDYISSLSISEKDLAELKERVMQFHADILKEEAEHIKFHLDRSIQDNPENQILIERANFIKEKLDLIKKAEGEHLATALQNHIEK